jgi:tetratricopeptide (TPR) repeat protein
MLGSLDDIRYAFEALEELRVRGDDSDERALLLTTALNPRFERRGRLSDVDRSIAILKTRNWRQASPFKGEAQLGEALALRASITDDCKDWSDAATAFTNAINECDSESRSASFLTNRASCYKRIAELLGDETYGKKALQDYESAFALTPTNSLDHWGLLSNWGDALNRSCDPVERERGVQLLSEAARAVPEGSMYYATIKNCYAVAQRRRFDETGDLVAFNEARANYRVAAGATVASSEELLRIAGNWGVWAIDRGEWAEATEAFDHVLCGVRQMVSQERFDAQRAQVLLKLGEVPSLAEYAYPRAGWAWKALEVLEMFRATKLAEALGRTPHSEIGSAERAKVELLEGLLSDAMLVHKELNLDSTLAKVDGITEELNDFWAAHSAPFVPTFTKPNLSQIFGHSTDSGSVIYVIDTRLGGMALVLRDDDRELEIVWLPELTAAEVVSRVNKYLQALRRENRGEQIEEVTAWL